MIFWNLIISYKLNIIIIENCKLYTAIDNSRYKFKIINNVFQIYFNIPNNTKILFYQFID